jgi:lysozyme family protein
MKDNFDAALKAILHHEGGFVNHPKDPGGMTNLGVTKKVWEEWVGHEVDEKTMRGLTPEIVGPMYKVKYWDKVKGDDYDSINIAVFVTGMAWGSGSYQAIKSLQKSINDCGVKCTVDGKIGPKTISASNSIDARKLFDALTAERERFFRAISKGKNAKFLKGWLNRLEDYKKKFRP